MDPSDLPSLDFPLMRLSCYRAEREREEVAAALEAEPRDRTPAQETTIAYSAWGTAAKSCHCGPGDLPTR